MTDLVIIHPAATHGIYGALGDRLVAVEPPAWARMIAGYVIDHGFKVQIIDAEAEDLRPIEAAVRASHWNPRIVAIAAFGHQPSASTQQMVGASATAKALRQACPRATTVLLGGHVSALPERTLKEEQVDFAVKGEGPATLVGLLKAEEGSAFSEIPGLVWRGERGAITVNPSAPLIPIEELHGDVWDLLPMKRYRAHNWQCFGESISARQPYASIVTSLGCPYKCSFCCINAPFGVNRYRMRDPAAVVAQIAMLHDRYGVKILKIVDEMFILNEKHYTAIAQGLIDKGLGDKLNIWAYARIDTVKPETLTLLRSAGFRWLALGIESGSKHVRDGAEKALKNDDIVGTVRAIQAAGINVIGNYIFGLPDDDAESLAATLGLSLELRTEFANFYSAMAYPGSHLYTQALESGATLPSSWSGYSQHNADCRPLDTEHVHARDVLKFRDEAFVKYFSVPEYQAMIAAKFGPRTVEHVQDMLKYKLRRKLLEGTIA